MRKCPNCNKRVLSIADSKASGINKPIKCPDCNKFVYSNGHSTSSGCVLVLSIFGLSYWLISLGSDYTTWGLILFFFSPLYAGVFGLFPKLYVLSKEEIVSRGKKDNETP